MTNNTEENQESFFEGLSKFIKENKEFLMVVFGQWSKSTSLQLCTKMALMFLIIIMSGVLTFTGNISGETLAGIIGVVIGYVLGKGSL